MGDNLGTARGGGVGLRWRGWAVLRQGIWTLVKYPGPQGMSGTSKYIEVCSPNSDRILDSSIAGLGVRGRRKSGM